MGRNENVKKLFDAIEKSNLGDVKRILGDNQAIVAFMDKARGDALSFAEEKHRQNATIPSKHVFEVVKSAYQKEVKKSRAHRGEELGSLVDQLINAIQAQDMSKVKDLLERSPSLATTKIEGTSGLVVAELNEAMQESESAKEILKIVQEAAEKEKTSATNREKFAKKLEAEREARKANKGKGIS